ncbi:hypothetical protein QBC39DRAFT_403424 [Podospora conica]|nr:hypothetical protein QBC39DRAFT_403424 [Schizothecium conicum]
MQSLIFTLLALAIAPALAQDGPNDRAVTTVTLPTGPPPPATTQTGCPTVTATRELCATCAIPLCLGLATVTQSCGCPSAVPTVYLDFPCEDNCKGVWCTTSYSVVTASGTCTSAGPPKPTTTGGSTTTSRGPPPPVGGTTTSRGPVVTAGAGRMAMPMWGGLF